MKNIRHRKRADKHIYWLRRMNRVVTIAKTYLRSLKPKNNFRGRMILRAYRLEVLHNDKKTNG